MTDMSAEQRAALYAQVLGKRGTKRSFVGPWLIPCTWTECDTPARQEHLVVVEEPSRNLNYLFCSERHRQLWINSPKDMGNLASGSKGLLT